jgi:uncharacterized membrane protein YhaH (DUF805 family)
LHDYIDNDEFLLFFIILNAPFQFLTQKKDQEIIPGLCNLIFSIISFVTAAVVTVNKLRKENQC